MTIINYHDNLKNTFLAFFFSVINKCTGKLEGDV